jgi:DNA polymerase-3 subunit alpha
MVALYRPGPMQMIPDFTARRHGKVKPTYEHPVMERHLQETYGIMVYQEQVLRIAADMAGFSMSEADDLRKAMGKKIPELMAEQRAKFLAGAKARGVKERIAERVFELMERFAGYGFNKAHATAYGIVAYQTAYLKANYPVEFMAALLTSEMGNTDKVVLHVEECRVMGLTVLPPDVNLSAYRFGAVGEAIRFGLGAVKNVGQKAIDAIVAARDREGPYRSLEDFCRRLDLQLANRRVIESLIKAGVFDSLGLPRAHLLAGLDAAMESAQRHQREVAQGQGSMFDLLAAAPEAAALARPEAVLPEWEPDQRLLHEKEVLGFYLSGHPLRRVWPRAVQLGVTGIAQLAAVADGARVALCGLVIALREVNTKNGNRMGFVTLEDVEGSVELTVFPEAFRQSAAYLKGGAPLLVRGRVEGSATARKVLADDIRPLPEEDAGAPAAPPRGCRVRVGSGVRPEDLDALRGVLARHRGPVPVLVHVDAGEREVVIRSRSVRVSPSPALVADVEGLLGAGTITFGDFVEPGDPVGVAAR